MKKICLDGEWLVKKLQEPNHAESISLPLKIEEFISALVPGDIHKDLQNAGLLSDPFYSDNLKNCEWVTKEHWCYVKQLTVDETLLKDHNTLVFSGIDTFADIYLNGILLGSCESMFIQYKFPVDGVLKQGENLLCVVLKSIAKEMEKLPHDGYNSCFNIERIFIRKPSCHFSWDWSPALFATGIYDTVVLESTTSTKINAINVKTQNSGFATFFFELDHEWFCEESSKYIKLQVNGKNFCENFIIEDVNEIKQYSIKIENPNLWWPIGFGEQHLYNFIAELYENDTLIDEKQGSFAIREITVDQTPTSDLSALRFVIMVNGVPIFLKGANWIPADIFTGVVTDEKYTALLELVTQGNMNCLRVWGGGLYEKDFFYNECDRLGILVWQDFMFACAELPDNYPGFYEKITEELTYQIKRLRNHPCIMLWSGGNERPGGIKKNTCLGKEKFEYLFRGIANHLDGTRPYFDNSPWGYEQPGNCLNSGDSHLSSMNESIYAHDATKFREVLSKLTASMMSEIACMGSSPISSVKKYIPEDQLWPTNDIWESHTRGNPYDTTGETFIIQQKKLSSQHFGEITGLCDFVKKSAVTQAEHVKADMEFHRSRAIDCSGALFWMFNDIWPCGSWSLVDYYLTKKAGYYAMKRSSRPLLPIISYHADGYKAFVSNETTKSYSGQLLITQQMTDGQVIKEICFDNLTANPLSATFVCDLTGFDTTLKNSIFFISYKSNNEEIIENSFIANKFLDTQFPTPTIEIMELIPKNDAYNLTIRSNVCVRVVNIIINDASISDNYFDMQANKQYTIIIQSKTPLTTHDIFINTFKDEWE